MSGFTGGLGGFMGGPWGAVLGSVAFPALAAMFAGNNDQTRRRERMIQSLLDPQSIAHEGQSLFEQTLASPGYAMARSSIMGAGQQGQAAVKSNLAQSGLLRSGVGNAAIGAAGAAPGIHLGQLSASAWQSAMANAQQRAGMRAQALGGTPVAPNYAGSMGAAGLNALLPYLFKMASRQGNGGMHAASPIGPEQFPGAFGDWAGMPRPGGWGNGW